MLVKRGDQRLHLCFGELRQHPDTLGAVGLLRTRDVAPEDIGAAILSSTVPPLIQTFQIVCRTHFHVEPIVVGPGVRTGVRVLYDNPREVGPDRILHAVAALDRYDPPMIIVDLGTACVFDAVSRDGDYLGGAIAVACAVMAVMSVSTGPLLLDVAGFLLGLDRKSVV